jgi:uncharacterized membrane protein
VAGVRKALERGLNPLLSVLPLCLFGAALLVDFGAIVSGFGLFGKVAYGVVALAILVGVVAATALLIGFTTAPVGSVAHRVRGLASASTTGMVVGFILAWFLRDDGGTAGNGAVLVLEALAFLGGLAGAIAARSPHHPRGLFETSSTSTEVGWPFGVH